VALSLLDVQAANPRYSAAMISTVAVGTDGSETAGIAVAAALELAERFGATLVVLSAYTGQPAASSVPRLSGGASNLEWASNDAQQAESILADIQERADGRGVQIKSDLAQGDPGEVLVQLAEKHGADVLVVGSKGMHRRVLGSVPNTVTHKAACTVYVVKTT
jgi:nucleotide-binding universal stress UspA family protein